MGYVRKPLKTAMLGAALAALPVVAPWAEVLVYQGINKWVAQDDNAPLQKLLQAARGGKRQYKVKLPLDGRELAIVRLEIVRDLLAREAKAAVVMEEVGVSRRNTVEVE